MNNGLLDIIGRLEALEESHAASDSIPIAEMIKIKDMMCKLALQEDISCEKGEMDKKKDTVKRTSLEKQLEEGRSKEIEDIEAAKEDKKEETEVKEALSRLARFRKWAGNTLVEIGQLLLTINKYYKYAKGPIGILQAALAMYALGKVIQSNQ